MIVLRIECRETRKGVYRYQLPNDWWFDHSERHPCPNQDGLGWVEPDLYFGFRDAKQLRQWFLDWMLRALWENYPSLVVAAYDAKEVRHGFRQCAFKRASAAHVGDMSLEEFNAICEET